MAKTADLPLTTVRRNVLLVAAEGRLLLPSLTGARYRLAADDGKSSMLAAADFNTAVDELIDAGQLKKNVASGKVEPTTPGRTTLTSWAGRAY